MRESLLSHAMLLSHRSGPFCSRNDATGEAARRGMRGETAEEAKRVLAADDMR